MFGYKCRKMLDIKVVSTAMEKIDYYFKQVYFLNWFKKLFLNSWLCASKPAC